jgi:hypothetical protein
LKQQHHRIKARLHSGDDGKFLKISFLPDSRQTRPRSSQPETAAFPRITFSTNYVRHTSQPVKELISIAENTENISATINTIILLPSPLSTTTII